MAQSWIFKAKGSPDGLFTVTVRAISDLGYSITHSDAGARTVSFETGMSWRTWQGQRMSANVVQNGGILELPVSGARTGAQLGQWGEKSAIAHKLWDRVLQLLKEAPKAPTETLAPARPDSQSSTASELERLARLHHDGMLTADEFASAKAKLLT